MSLNYHLVGREDNYFANLPKSIQDFYHNVLPWWMLGTSIGFLSDFTVPVLLSRLNFQQPLEVKRIQDALAKNKITLSRALEACIGLTTNVETLSTAKWLQRCNVKELPKGYSAYADEREHAKHAKVS